MYGATFSYELHLMKNFITMKNILLASMVIFFLVACNKESINISSKVIPSNMTFHLNHVDNVFFTKDKGSLISGVYNHKYTLIKTNDNFDIEWTKNNYEWGNLISGSGWGSSFYSIQVIKVFQSSDGSFICIGSIEEGGDVVYSSTLVIIINQQGDQIRKYEFKDLRTSNALKTSDGGYILFGSKTIKLDGKLNQQWEKNTSDYTYLQNQIVSTTDGGFAVTGSYNGDQMFLKKYDSNGNELLSRIYKHNNSPFEESGFDLIQLTDKGFLIIGRAGKTFVPNVIQCQILRTDAIGDSIWTQRFSYSTNSWLERFISCNQNEFVIQGSIGFPNENQKSTLIRINANGQMLDSLSTEKFQMLIYSPINYYIKVQNTDTAHVNFSKIDSDKLFN